MWFVLQYVEGGEGRYSRSSLRLSRERVPVVERLYVELASRERELLLLLGLATCLASGAGGGGERPWGGFGCTMLLR